MTQELHSEIDQYIAHFRGQHQLLQRVSWPLHQKILVVIMLDALARGRYPSLRNAERFTSLIKDHATWLHALRVSAPQLHMMISDKGGPEACGLDSAFMERLRGGGSGRGLPRSYEIVGLDADPTVEELLPVGGKQADDLLREAQHAARLYRYRCALVHEYREPGHGFEFDKRHDAPFYHTMSHGEAQGETIELVYPTGWFIGLLPPMLDSLAVWYREQGKNPYDSYKFGSPWR